MEIEDTEIEVTVQVKIVKRVWRCPYGWPTHTIRLAQGATEAEQRERLSYVPQLKLLKPSKRAPKA